MSTLQKLLALWATLPLTALDWWVAWSRLPARVVMKFGPNGQPIHWAAPEEAMKFDLFLLGGILVFLTVIGALALFARPEKERQLSTALLACAGFVALILNGILWAYQVG
ncbi:MAG TPA: hypothetical protein VGI39_08745 [Polyangiaceae bacterium]|jgi:hypothetical protein